MPHTTSRLALFFIITLSLASICLAQDDPRTLRLGERLAAAQTEDERTALMAAEKELVTSELVKSLMTQGNRLMNQGNYPQALTHYQIAQGIAERIGDKEGFARSINGFGNIHYLQGDYDRALDHYRKSITLSEASSDKAGIANSFFNIGLIYRAQGDYDRALEQYRQSLTLNEMMGRKENIANSLNSIGLVYRLQGNNGLALDYYQRAAAMYEAAGNKTGVAGTLNNIGNIYRFQGNNPLALEHYQRVLALAEALNSQTLINYAFSNMGTVHLLQGDYSRALGLYRRSLAIKEKLGDKSGIARTLNSIGEVYSTQSNYDAALEYHKMSLAIYEALGEKLGIAETLGSIGHVHGLQRQHSSALEMSERAVALASQIGSREILWNARTTAGEAHRALNQFAQARQSFEDAIVAIETLRSQVAGGEQEQQRFFEDKVSPYHAMVELLIAQNDPGGALRYAERAKARVLLDVLHSGRVNITKAMTTAEQQQERKLSGELVALNSQISQERARKVPDKTRGAELTAHQQQKRRDYEAFEGSLYAAHPELKVRRGEVQPVSLDETAALLPDARSALVQYVVTDDKTFLFALTQDGNKTSKPIDLKVYTLDVKRKDLAARVAHFREQLARRDVRFAASARELHALLLAPAGRELHGKRTLVIVPDAALWELPFQALQSATNHFLIEDYAVSYAPSLTVLREMKRARRKKPRNAPTSAATLLAFGNPTLGKPTMERVKSVMMDGELDPLPEAEKQVQALFIFYVSSNSVFYTGGEAREERVKAEAGNYKILQ
ncbi:MAG: tetratricopeptide repeat protein, partial [Acidobacteriota bacterium]|nr:tetratricopeptide repeat protein [Acidobacteriota bacterium]